MSTQASDAIRCLITFAAMAANSTDTYYAVRASLAQQRAHTALYLVDGAPYKVVLLLGQHRHNFQRQLLADVGGDIERRLVLEKGVEVAPKARDVCGTCAAARRRKQEGRRNRRGRVGKGARGKQGLIGRRC